MCRFMPPSCLPLLKSPISIYKEVLMLKEEVQGVKVKIVANQCSNT